MKPNLYFTIGLPRSGKSTISNCWSKFQCDFINGKVIERQAEESKHSNPFYRIYPYENARVVAESDAIRDVLHGSPFIRTAEDVVYTTRKYMVAAHLRQGYDVLIDGTNTSIDSIYRILQISSKAKPIRVNTSKLICLDRAKATKQQYLYPVIERCSQNLTKIDKYGLSNIIDKINRNIQQGIHSLHEFCFSQF